MELKIKTVVDQSELELTSEDRRQHARKSFRTVGEVHLINEGFSVKVWTQDVSVSGTRLVAKQPIYAKNFLLALIMPHQRDTILECEVVSSEVEVKELLNGTEIFTYIYCVRFLRKADRSEIEKASLIDQTEIDPKDVVNSMLNTPPQQAETSKKKRWCSLFPLLTTMILACCEYVNYL